jgi:hypothetical protein
LIATQSGYNNSEAKAMLNLLRTHPRVVATIFGSLTWLFFAASGTTNHVAAISYLPPLQMVEPFLSVPYYGVKEVKANVDHDQLNSDILNGRILIYNNKSANSANGWCDDASNSPHIAFWTALNPPRDCLWYDAHHGHDFSLDYEPVLAAADGTVVRAGWQNWNDRYAGYGLHLRISHANGYETRYGHLSALAVVTNAIVYRGQIIGTSGNTGNSSGAHLHFEVRLNGQVTDPFGGAGADWLWHDGSWDAQGRWVGQSIPQYGATYMVDDDYPEGGTTNDPNFEKGHSSGSCPPDQCLYWYTATIGINNRMFWTYVSDSTPDYWARWLPPQDGLFDVQVYIPGGNATTWQARYWWLSAYNGMPDLYTIIDQWGISNRWISLGVQPFGRCFSSTGLCGIWLSDATDEGADAHGAYASLCNSVVNGHYYCKIGVDAVRFRAPWPAYIPIVLNEY